VATEKPFQAFAIWVLTVDGDLIAEITAFLDPELLDPQLLAAFGLPAHVSSELQTDLS
jgi:hypothetical protein